MRVNLAYPAWLGPAAGGPSLEGGTGWPLPSRPPAFDHAKSQYRALYNRALALCALVHTLSCAACMRAHAWWSVVLRACMESELQLQFWLGAQAVMANV